MSSDDDTNSNISSGRKYKAPKADDKRKLTSKLNLAKAHAARKLAKEQQTLPIEREEKHDEYDDDNDELEEDEIIISTRRPSRAPAKAPPIDVFDPKQQVLQMSELTRALNELRHDLQQTKASRRIYKVKPLTREPVDNAPKAPPPTPGPTTPVPIPQPTRAQILRRVAEY